MSALSKQAAEVEREIGAEWTKYHVGAQALRFLSGVVVTLLWSMHAGFGDWTDLLPLLVAAGWTTAAQMWPQVPWTLVREHLDAVRPATPKAAAPFATGGYIPGPGAIAPAAVPPPVAGTDPAPPTKG